MPLHLHCFQHPQISSPPLPRFRPKKHRVIRLSPRKGAYGDSLKLYSHLMSLKALLGNAATRTPGTSLYQHPHKHKQRVLFSHLQAHVHLVLPKQNKELPARKHPREEEPHVADATALLNASLKAFQGPYCCDE